MRLTLHHARKLRVRLLYGNTEKPIGQTPAGARRREIIPEHIDVISWAKTNDAGEVALSLPPGKYDLTFRPDRATLPAGYVPTKLPLVVEEAPQEQSTVVRAPPATTLEVEVVDGNTGQAVSNISVAAQSDGDTPSENVWLAIGQTDAEGTLRKLVEPGRRRYSVLPQRGYATVDGPNESLELAPGKTTNVRFKVRKQEQSGEVKPKEGDATPEWDDSKDKAATP